MKWTLRDWIIAALATLVLALYAKPFLPIALQAQGIHHLKVCTVPDTGDLTKIQCSDWNAPLVVWTVSFGAMNTPPTPVDGDLWLEQTGVSPNRILAVKVRDLGITRTLASIQF